jgi:hypothetical protein
MNRRDGHQTPPGPRDPIALPKLIGDIPTGQVTDCPSGHLMQAPIRAALILPDSRRRPLRDWETSASPGTQDTPIGHLFRQADLRG